LRREVETLLRSSEQAGEFLETPAAQLSQFVLRDPSRNPSHDDDAGGYPEGYRVGPYRPPYGWYVRAWGYGDILPSGWYGSNFWIDDFYDYDLPWPPPGMHWVRVGDDAFLVDDYSGRIVQVIRDMFW